MRVYWQPSVNSVPIAVSVAPRNAGTRLAPKGSFTSALMIFADRNNSAMVCVGPSNLSCGVGALPNGSFYQLDAGRSAFHHVDDPESEMIDVGDFYVAQDGAAGTAFVYVTTWQRIKVP